MPLVLSIIAPIFILIALGALVSRLKLLPASAGDTLTGFVFLIAIPLLLFRTVATANFGEANPFLLWLSYFAGVVPVYAAGMILGRMLGGTDRRGAVVAGVAASFSNLVFIAIPVVERAFGREGLDALALIIAVHMPTMMIASTLLLERAVVRDAREGGSQAMPARSVARTLAQIGRNLSRNTLVIGLLGGLLWRLSGLPLEGPHGDVVRLLSGTAGPLALFALGMSLRKYRIRGALLTPALITCLALIVQPLIVLAVGVSILPPLWLAVAVTAAACPVGINAYLLATYFRAGESLSASVIVVSTIASAVTMTLWLALMT